MYDEIYQPSTITEVIVKEHVIVLHSYDDYFDFKLVLK